jgi:hypothetical protein
MAVKFSSFDLQPIGLRQEIEAVVTNQGGICCKTPSLTVHAQRKCANSDFLGHYKIGSNSKNHAGLATLNPPRLSVLTYKSTWLDSGVEVAFLLGFAILFAYIGAYLGGGQALGFILIASGIGASTYYFLKRIDRKLYSSRQIIETTITSLLLLLGILCFGGHPFGTNALIRSPYGHQSRQEGEKLLSAARNTAPKDGEVMTHRINSFLIENSQWISNESFLWRSRIGKELNLQQEILSIEFAKYQANKQLIREQFNESHPLGKLVHVRDDRSIKVDGMRTYDKIEVPGYDDLTIKADGHTIVAISMTAVNTGKIEGSMSWSTFTLLDHKDNRFGPISESPLTIERWRESRGLSAKNEKLRPGSSSKIIYFYKIPDGTHGLRLQVNNEIFRISPEPLYD